MPDGLLRYPYEAITQTTDYLQIRIFKYARAKDNTVIAGPQGSGQVLDVSNYVSNKAKVLEPGGVIILPMPSNIQDSNVVSYDSDSMNTFAAKGVDAVQKVMGGAGKKVSDFLTTGPGTATLHPDVQAPADPSGMGSAVSNAITAFMGQEAQRAMTANLAIQAVNVFGANVSFNSLLARTEGKILNPNMELLFNNVTLRTFRFSFKLAPRDPNEAQTIKSIIRTFKKNMAAQKSGDNGVFLQTPNMFKLTYRKGNQNHPFLHRFKDCALSDMNVQYTGDNVYATYSDGTPVSMIMNLTFKELMPLYSSDYDTDDDGGDMKNNQDQMKYQIADPNVSSFGNSQNVEGVGF